jgi:hypothetical protein
MLKKDTKNRLRDAHENLQLTPCHGVLWHWSLHECKKLCCVLMTQEVVAVFLLLVLGTALKQEQVFALWL